MNSCVLRCNENVFFLIWSSLAIIHQFILHAAAIALAILTRKVKVNALNDSKYTAAGIYISTMLTIILLVVIFQLEAFKNTLVSVITTVVFLDSTTFLVLTFVPKVV